MSTKKKAAKKVAKKATKAKVFDLMDEEMDIVAQTRESLADMAAKNKNKKVVRVLDHNTFEDPGLPLLHMALQLFFGAKQLRSESLNEIIAKEACGKTSFNFTLVGYAALANIATVYIETESKLMERSRIERCLHANPAIAARIADRINICRAGSLDEMWNVATAEVKCLRETNKVIIPKEFPILVVLDSFSKLMSIEEARGRSAYGDHQSAAALKKQKDTSTATNLGHSGFSHVWCRELPTWLRSENIIFLVNSHQNDKIDMTGMMGAAQLAAVSKVSKTKVGGNATNQTASTQLVINRKGFYNKSHRGAQTQMGHIMEATTVKNSYGPDNNKMQYNLMTRHPGDTPDHMEPVLDFDQDLAKFLTDNKYLGTTANMGRYTSTDLKMTGCTATELCQALHTNEEAMNHLGKQLQIIGYGR